MQHYVIGSIVVPIGVALVCAACWRDWFPPENTEWETAPGQVMRRRVNGHWQYRDMTYEEWIEDFDNKAW